MLRPQLLGVWAKLAAFGQAIHLLWRRRELLFEMTRRDVVDRYAGQVLGASWAVIAPLLTMATYLFAFGVIFRSRIEPDDNGTGYVAFALAGLVPWMGLQEGLNRSTSAIVGNGNLVKQIVFPSEVLPLKVALGTLPALLIGLVVTICVSAISGRLHWTGLVLLPTAVLCYVLLLAGLSYLLAAVGVFVRDVKDLVGFFLTVGLFLHPVLYTPQGIPNWLGPVFVLSPFSHMIWCFRDALVGPDPQHVWSWVVFPIFAVLSYALGWQAFRVLKPTFGNVL